MISPVNFLTLKTTSFKAAHKNANSKNKTNPADRAKVDAFIQSFLEYDFSKAKKPSELKRGQFFEHGKIVYNSGTTSMFRPDINWQNFGDYLKHRFRGQKEVNTIVYACSDGSEPYSLSILLQDRFKNNAKRFFPIRAKDIDEGTIEENIAWQRQKETIYQNAIAKEMADLRLPDKELLKYMRPAEGCASTGILSEKTKKPVEFSCANILEDLENINPDVPSLVMCRNMWPYVDYEEYEGYAKALYERLAPGSVVVVGSFDYSSMNDAMTNFPEALKAAGFSEAWANVGKRYKLAFEKN